MALLDLGQILLHPIKTVQDLWGVGADLVALRGMQPQQVAEAPSALARYDQARARLEASTFKRLLPFLDRSLARWADARVQSWRGEVQGKLSERAWHPIVIEWPVGGTGHQKLEELRALMQANSTATEGQMVRAFQGVNRVRFLDSTPMDYFYPLARSGDALLLRRNLPLIPGQRSVQEHLQGLLNQSVQVHVQIQ